jgi:hypothetical protein
MLESRPWISASSVRAAACASSEVATVGSGSGVGLGAGACVGSGAGLVVGLREHPATTATTRTTTPRDGFLITGAIVIEGRAACNPTFHR